MDVNEVMNSKRLIQRFCKNYNLPIAVFEEPYFHQRLFTIDSLFDCVQKFETFVYELADFETEEKYFEYYNKLKDEVINAIKNNSSFHAFNQRMFIPPECSVGNKNLYTDLNDCAAFYSIDMKQANFSALHHFDPEMFDVYYAHEDKTVHCDTWEDFIANYTPYQHIIDSKYIRQVILGACNPGKQIQYETYLMKTLYQHLVDTLGPLNAYSINADEIILTVENDNQEQFLNAEYSNFDLLSAVKSCPRGIGELVRVEKFWLKKFGNVGWLKYNRKHEEKNIPTFKCVDAEIFHQVVKKYFNKPITEDDLVFYHNKRLARFMEEIDPWQKD